MDLLSFTFSSFFLVCAVYYVGAVNVINNSILNDPVVKCGPENIDVQAVTSFPFEGVVYIKDWRRSPGCFLTNTAFASNSSAPHLSVPLHELGRCGMEMKRNVGTGDVVIKGVWVFSFHPMFVTRVDRAFSVNCIFKQKEYTVTSKFIVNDLSTKLIGRTATMPSVVMKIVTGSEPDQRLADAATVRVGDPIQILWFLPTQSNVVGIRVKHCTAESRRGNRVHVINDGCSTDSFAVSDVTYSPEKDKAHAFANAFKFADNEDMWFKCTVSVCMKMPSKSDGLDESCNMIQSCGKEARTKRSVRSDIDIGEFLQSGDEVLEKRIYILDSYNKNDRKFKTNNDSRITLYAPRAKAKVHGNLQRSGSVCMSQNLFAVLTSLLVLTYITCFTIIFIAMYVYCQRKNE